ncbi:MAG: hypothetical protein WD270_07565 [Acetobacterales bacterium]
MAGNGSAGRAAGREVQSRENGSDANFFEDSWRGCRGDAGGVQKYESAVTKFRKAADMLN